MHNIDEQIGELQEELDDTIEDPINYEEMIERIDELEAYKEEISEDDDNWEYTEEAKEALLVVKTRLDKLNELISCVKSIHPYQVPEIIAIPIIYGLESYLKWIDETVSRRS